MIPFQKKSARSEEDEKLLRSIGAYLEEIKGELPCEKLTRAAWEWSLKQCNIAKQGDDIVLDYTRKRTPHMFVRYGLVYSVLRQYENLIRGEELVIDEKDVQFGELIAEFCQTSIIYIYGNMILSEMERETNSFIPRKKKNVLDILPSIFSLKDYACINNISAENAKRSIRNYIEKGLIEKYGNDYKKI